MALRTNGNFCINHWQIGFFITEMESVYSAVRTESLYNTDTSCILKVIHPLNARLLNV